MNLNALTSAAPRLTWRAAMAAVCVTLVLMLSGLAKSPTAHEQIHDGCAQPDHVCAVVLFAHGVSLAIGTIAVPAPSLTWHEPSHATEPELFLAVPRYLRQPERGPPAA